MPEAADEQDAGTLLERKDVREGWLCLRHRDGQIAHRHQAGAAGDRGAVDRGDGRLGQRVDQIVNLRQPQRVVPDGGGLLRLLQRLGNRLSGAAG